MAKVTPSAKNTHHLKSGGSRVSGDHVGAAGGAVESRLRATARASGSSRLKRNLDNGGKTHEIGAPSGGMVRR